MSDLTPEDTALLDLARGGHDPSTADRERVRTAVVAQLGIAAALVTSSAGAVGGASAAGSVLSGAGLLAAKVLGVVAVMVSVTAGGVALHRTLRVAPPRVPTTAANALVPTPAASVRTSVLESDIPVVTPFLEVAPTPEPSPLAKAGPALTAHRSREMVSSVPNGVANDKTPEGLRSPGKDGSEFAPEIPSAAPAVEANVPEQAATATTLLAETDLIRAGLAALHGGDPSRALTLFDEHAGTFPAGVLADERDIERITALCELGRSGDARAAAASFLRRRPNAPLTRRVLTSCGNPSPSIP